MGNRSKFGYGKQKHVIERKRIELEEKDRQSRPSTLQKGPANPSDNETNAYIRAARRCRGSLYAAKYGDPMLFMRTALDRNKRRK
jgi:hypothetical protein